MTPTLTLKTSSPATVRRRSGLGEWLLVGATGDSRTSLAGAMLWNMLAICDTLEPATLGPPERFSSMALLPLASKTYDTKKAPL